MKSKGQVTISIILGLVLLIAVGLVFYIRSTAQKEIHSDIKRAEDVPDQFQPVSQFVTSCLSRTTTEALTKLGNRGGYIEPERYNINSVTADPTGGGAVQFSPRSSLKIPYWFYLKSDNRCRGNCEFTIQMPPLHATSANDNSIETQISHYIEENIERCTANFQQFAVQGMQITTTGDLSAKTVVTQNDVAITLRYPLKIIQNNVEQEVNQFSTTASVNLAKIYQLGGLLTSLESEFRYLENDVLNMIVLFSGINNKKLPPMSELEFKFGGAESWTKTSVKNNIQNMLMSYIPFLKVTGTSNYEPFTAIGNELQEALYNVHNLVPLNQSFSDLEVHYTYLDFWPVYFDLNCDGEHCTAESVSTNVLSLMGIQRYNFVYDLSFPVMVEIYDKNALNGQGYTFRYFLEGNIRNNEVLKSDFVPLESVNPDPSSLLCKESSKNSGDITIAVKENGKPVDGVDVFYTCAGESCSIGKTKNGALVSKFPICIGGLATFNKKGYLGRSEIISTDIDQAGTIETEMHALTTIPLELQKKKMIFSNGKWAFDNTPVALNDKEYGTITFRRKGDILDDDMVATAEYRPGENVSIDLAPGEYELDIRLFTDEKVEIPADKRCEGNIISTCYTVPKVEINDTFPNGGVKINMTITQNELNAGKIIVYAISPAILDIPPADRKVEMMEQINKVDEYSAENEENMNPRFA